MTKAKAKKKVTALDILSFKPNLTEVEIDGIDGVVFVKEFTTKTRAQFMETTDVIERQAVLIVNGICDEDGEPLFETKDIAQLSNLRADIVDSLYHAVLSAAAPSNEKEIVKK